MDKTPSENTDNNDKTPPESQEKNQSLPTDQETPKTTKQESASAPKRSSNTRDKKKSSSLRWLKYLFLLLIFGGIAAASYYGWQKYQAMQNETLQAENNAQVLLELQAELRRQQDLSSALADELTQVQKNLEQRIAVGEDRIAAQHRRLQAMSTTSREDWQLAEAEYLLKLANQRVLIEKNASSAVALLEEADSILKELDTLDIFSLRQALARDLAALKLADKVDVEGLYLRIDALSQQIDNLPLYATKVEEARGIAPPIGDDDTPAKRSMLGFFSSLKDYVRVVDHAEKPQVLLGPESTLYLQQNLRLVLERAQLALLREQSLIYQQSLEQAQGWITRFFPATDKAAAFKQELELLSEQAIVSELPDIRGSLELLHNYIDELHRLGETKKPTDDDQ
jgi:uroporphyrin-3 C-methyltransferase